MKTEAEQSPVLFLLVCYFNEQEIREFVDEQLSPQTFQNYRVIIADNGSRDKTVLPELAQKDPRVRIHTCDANRGYFGGAFAAMTDDPNNVKTKLVILCNTDIRFTTVDFVEKLLIINENHPFHVLGPDVFSERFNLHQNPYIPERISRRKLKTLKFFSSGYYLYNVFLAVYYLKNFVWPGMIKKNTANASEPRPVYSVHGSFMVFSCAFFESGGTFSYDSFLFGEEIFVGEQARDKGMLVRYDPSLQIIHKEHTTTGIFKSKSAVKFHHQSYTYLLERYY